MSLKKQIDSLQLKASVQSCAQELELKEKTGSFQTKAGEMVLGNGEVVQVQIIVTRDPREMLGEFEYVEHTNLAI